MTLEEVKLYIKVEHTDEDILIESLILAAKAYITQTTGKVFIETDELMCLCTKLLVSHWFDTRSLENKGTLQTHAHTVDALLAHIVSSSFYKSEGEM